MLKQALPRHAASNDLLKKHISTPFSWFSHFISYLFILLRPADSVFSPRFEPFSPHCGFYFYLFLSNLSFAVFLPLFCFLPHQAGTYKCLLLYISSQIREFPQKFPRHFYQGKDVSLQNTFILNTTDLLISSHFAKNVTAVCIT